MKQQIVGLLLFLVCFGATAHPMDVCLHRLAQSATELKACQLAQDQAGQCDRFQSTLNTRRDRCEHEGFIYQDIDKAIAYGLKQLDGDIKHSPYARQVEKQRWENSQMRSNVESFKRYFPDFSQFTGDIMTNFNTPQCPSEYIGQSGSWQFIKPTTLKRYPMNSESKTRSISVYFMSEMSKGTCYKPNPASAEYLAVNLPDVMLLEMEKSPDIRIVRCQTPSCKGDIDSMGSLYKRYERQYREYRNLAVCADIDLKNEERRVIKGKKQSKRALPEYCPSEEIQVKALNAKGNLDQLIQLLFQDVNVGIKTVKIQ